MIDKLRELHEKATPGPWKATWGEDFFRDKKRIEASDCLVANKSLVRPEDAELIVAMRNALPKLLAVLQAAQKAVKDARYYDTDMGPLCITPSLVFQLKEALAALEEKV